MPQRTRVIILMAVTTVFAAVVLVIISVMKPEAFPRSLREFGGLLVFGWVAVLAPIALQGLTARRLRPEGAAGPVPGERLGTAGAAGLAPGG